MCGGGLRSFSLVRAGAWGRREVRGGAFPGGVGVEGVAGRGAFFGPVRYARKVEERCFPFGAAENKKTEAALMAASVVRRRMDAAWRVGLRV